VSQPEIKANAANTIDVDKVTAAVHQAMRAPFPDQYTPALADAVAADTITRLDKARRTATESGSATTPAADIIAQIHANADAANKAGLGGPAMDAFNAEVIRLVSESPNPEATVGELAQLLHREPVRTTSCRLFPTWCIETGPHYDHRSTDHTITDMRGEDILDARILHFSGSTPTVCIGQSDFTPEQAREKAGELRCLADRIDELAAHVEAAPAPRA
jgi:hypothetical protein